ncbi:MAG: hypothetical protein KF861_07215 [Planctomycetaceae bacterium]|nr:hypothetical protein [Planctomycetaceae bacterium]
MRRLFALRLSGLLHTAVIVAAIAIAGFSNAAELESQPQRGTPHRSIPPRGDWIEKSYDVTSVIQRIASEDGVSTEEAIVRCRTLLKFLANQGRPLPTSDEKESDPSIRSNTEERSATVTITPNNDAWQLDLWAPEAAHAQAQHLLQAWAIGGLRQIIIDARIVTSNHKLEDLAGIQWTSLMRARAASSHGSLSDELRLVPTEENAPSISAKAAVEESLPVLISHLNAEEHRRFVNAAQPNKGTNVITAPQVTMFNGQYAEVTDLVQRPYVTAVGFTDEGVQAPQIDLFDDGLRLAFEPQITSDGTATNLVSHVALTNIDDVKTVTANLRGQKATVQSPKVSSVRIDISAEIPHGQALLACVPPTHDRRDYTYVILMTKLLPVGTGWNKSSAE